MNERAKKLIRQYVSGSARTMQLATLSDDQPWVSTVYFVADDELNLYWLSWPSRRHSKEIAAHDKVAAAIVIKFDQPIIGLQIEGKAEKVNNAATVAEVMELYVAKYGAGEKFYDNFVSGKNQHHMYRLRPSLFVLMDEVNFKEEGRIEWRTGDKK